MNHRISFYALLVAVAGCFLFSCNKGEETASSDKESASLKQTVPKGQIRLERIPTKKKANGDRELKWRLTPSDDDLVITCGLMGSKGHGSSSISGPKLGPAQSSGLVVTFDETKVTGDKVLAMVGELSSVEIKTRLMMIDPKLQKGELKWFTLQLSSNTIEGESSTTNSGVIPGSTRQARDGLFASSEKDGVNHFAIGERYVLAMSMVRVHDVAYGAIHSSGSKGSRLMMTVDGDSVPLSEYQLPAWALWVEVNRKQ